MLAPFDIFKADETGHLLWCGEAHTLDDAKLKVQAISRSHKMSFVVFNQTSGERLVVEPDSTGSDTWQE